MRARCVHGSAVGAARLFAFHRKGGGGVYSTETRVALVKERARAKERQRQTRVYAAALALAALAAGIALGATLRSTKTKEEMT